MTVYVDYAFKQFGRMRMCHMVADTLEELHEMADAIGLERKWFQHGDHYDVSKTKRRLAIRRGAKEISRRELGIWLRDRRRNAEKLESPLLDGS